VGSVAERLVPGRLAAAEPQFLGLAGEVGDRGHAGALVRAVTEGLIAAAPASAPEIPLALLDGEIVGRLLRRDRSVHLSSLPSPLLVSGALRPRASGRGDFRRGPPTRQGGGRQADATARTLTRAWRSTRKSAMTICARLSRSTTSARCCPAKGSPRGSRT